MITKEQVFDSLDNAIKNEYDFALFTAFQIAEDLHEYDSSFENVEPIELVPFVVAWQDSRRESLGVLVGFPSNIISK